MSIELMSTIPAAVPIQLSAQPLDEATANLRTARMMGIDATRAVAAFAVVCIHAGPLFPLKLAHGPFDSAGEIINQLARFAVPFFFAASGYFFARGLTRHRPLDLYFRQAKKLAFLFIAWSIIYLFVPETADTWRLGLPAAIVTTVHAKIAIARMHPLSAILEGTGIHLWFFPSLMVGLVFATLFAMAGRGKLFLPFALILYLMGMIVGPYSGIIFRSHHAGGALVHELLTPAAFVAIGFCVAAQKPIAPRWAWTILIAGFVLHFSEAILLHRWIGKPIWENDCLLGTLLMGWGTILIATATESNSGSGTGVGNYLALIGPLALGIYVLHPLFRPLFFLIGDSIDLPITFSLLMPFLLFIPALGVTWLLRRLALTAPLVS